MLVAMCLTHPSSLTHLHLVTLVVVAITQTQLGVFLHHHCNGYLTVGDYEYFRNLKDKCFNLSVGEAFFSYLMTNITDEESNKFLGQRDFPARGIHSPYMVEPCVAGYPPLF